MPHKTATARLTGKKKNCKHVVRFDAKEGTNKLITNGVYVSKEVAEEMLDCEDLNDVKGIEVTIRIVS